MLIRVPFAAVTILVFMVVATMRIVLPDPTRDLFAYQRAVEQAEAGRTMYDAPLSAGPHTPADGVNLPYVYPPFLAATLSLLPEMEPQVFARVWMGALFLAFCGLAACLARIASGGVTLYRMLSWAIVLALLSSVTGSLGLGQADVLIWAFVGLAFAVPGLAGFGLAAAGLLKLYAFWSIAAALFRRDWRTVRWAAATVASALLIGVIALGPVRFASECTTWLLAVFPTLAQGQFETARVAGGIVHWITERPLPLANLSPTLLPLRALGLGHEVLPGWARVYLLVISIGMPLLVAWQARRWPVERHYLATLAAALIFAPICRPAYLITLLPVASMAYRRWRVEAGQRLRDHASRSQRPSSRSVGLRPVERIPIR